MELLIENAIGKTEKGFHERRMFVVIFPVSIDGFRSERFAGVFKENIKPALIGLSGGEIEPFVSRKTDIPGVGKQHSEKNSGEEYTNEMVLKAF